MQKERASTPQLAGAAGLCEEDGSRQQTWQVALPHAAVLHIQMLLDDKESLFNYVASLFEKAVKLGSGTTPPRPSRSPSIHPSPPFLSLESIGRRTLPEGPQPEELGEGSKDGMQGW